LHSSNALIRAWAMFDRRLGKRRLRSMEFKPTDPHLSNAGISSGVKLKAFLLGAQGTIMRERTDTAHTQASDLIRSASGRHPDQAGSAFLLVYDSILGFPSFPAAARSIHASVLNRNAQAGAV
jgi:hypothetical protein